MHKYFHKLLFSVITAVMIMIFFSHIPQAFSLNNPSTTFPVQAQSSITLDESLVSIPDELVVPIKAALRDKPEDVLNGKHYILMSARIEDEWALISIAALPDSDAHGEHIGMGESGGLIIANKIRSHSWEVAIEGTHEFIMMVQQSPEAFISQTARDIVLTDGSQISLAESFEYKFPWSSNVSGWLTSYRQDMWHGGRPGLSGLDFFPQGDWRLLAAAEGVVTKICVGSISINVAVKDSNGVTVEYVHLEKNGFDSSILGKTIPRGYVLGMLKPGTWNDLCGSTSQTSTNAHVHWNIPTDRTIVVDGWSIRYPINYLEKDGVKRGPGSYFSSTNQPVTTLNQPPNPPTQIAPTNGTFTTNQTVTFTWNNAGDPNSRDFSAEVWKSDNSWKKQRHWSTATSWSITVPGPGTYQWRVKAQDGAAESTWSSTWSFSVNYPPRTPSLVAPAHDSAINSSSVTLEWKDNSDPDNKPNSYRQYYAELYQNGTRINQQDWTRDTSWNIPPLSPGIYQWRVKASDGSSDNSDWSGWWRFTIDTVPPTGSLTINHGWETTDSIHVPLDLNASDEHSGVQEMRLGTTCNNRSSWQPFQSRFWWQLSGQHGDTTRVCVQYRDRAGNVSRPIERSIRLDFYPAHPSSVNYRLPSDVSASSGIPHQSSRYRLNNTAGQMLASSNYAASSNYRAAFGFWPRIFQTVTVLRDNQPPNRPTMLTPANGTTTHNPTPTFTWQDNGDPDNNPQMTRSFRVSLYRLDGTQVAESGWISETSWTPPALHDGTYQWQVKAFDGAAESAGTGAWNITVATSDTPPAPYFTSDYTVGGPGSTFVFTAGHFPAGAITTISIREPGMSDFRFLTQQTIAANGTLVFVLYIPTSAAAGEYTVRIAVDEQELLLATAGSQSPLMLEQALTIGAEEPPHTDSPPDGVPILELGGAPHLYLPLIVR